jgi:hypothetical protein
MASYFELYPPALENLILSALRRFKKFFQSGCRYAP